ncbi:restriction endonuclease [Flavobacterium subsaxonicum]|uniref:Restriction endonuclease type IV Mrr domain-containing protein n=1 Tax=Flavobacterium subsaxonicum WB 4.1-42 = DSM 21790 TaxID=1121898 RepID=A0A0A2MVQ7_9FLAO|nr:restriction endonuclease [Flavobacterium subsaxonicum]KGO92310.1 hypothetical protein Q766_12625 [Flavobacterium subsaxonicum WB 4.1-42 = DSM 21790]
MKAKTKADKRRNYLIFILTSKDNVVDLYALKDIEEDDIEDIKIQLESYISKYKNCGLKIDYNTSRIFKSKNIIGIASYVDNLSAIRFEKFAALIIKFFGYEITYATKISHDQGIDFVGVKRFQLFDSKRESYLIGQAKKYNVLVNVNEVRGFAGAVILLRSKEFSQSKKVYEKLIMKSFTPIEGIFVTSYFFSPPATTLCENADIISLDFIDLVLLTEKAILEKKLEIETNNVFIKAKADQAVNKIVILN